MRIFTILAIFVGCLAIPAYAQQGQFSDEVARELVPIRNNIQALKDTAKAGIISEPQAQAGIARYMLLAAKVSNRPVTIEELLSIQIDRPVQLSTAQKFVGYITFINILWVAAILIGVVSFIYLFGRFIAQFAMLFLIIPVWFYELLLYVASIGVIFGGDYFRPGVGQFVALTGCLLFAGALGLTLSRFKGENPFWYFLLVTVVWSVTAWLYTSPLIGFFAAVALMGALGFFVAIHPLVYVVGFKDEDSVGRATVAAFCMLGFFVGANILGIYLPTLGIFQQGILFMGSFVGYLGLLIASSRWYPRRYPYVFFQLITICAGILALFVGSVYQIPELSRIGGTFFALYLLEKFCEIPVSSRTGYAFIGLTASASVYWFCMTVKNNPELFRPYLLF